MPGDDLPNIAEVIAAALARVSPEHRPLLIAYAERLAADRYRGWADEAAADATRDGLRACAAREEDIAGRVEALFPGAAAIQRDLLAANGDLLEVNRTLFAGRPVRQQYTLQARGERLGAATWRALAEHQPAARDTFLVCARLEEESAAFLESLLERE
jgi:hypothetical protein